ncbi:MAG: putative 6-pyruvoyl tetrahydropterin synthase [Rickettsiaceae bacterium]|nr:putative 6-pyruvoyl tetrahydropterin synthase [Rickettsiaceae bacterium]
MNHASKCKMLHGHRYVVEATFVADQLDELGMVIDFGIAKEILGGWIDQNWDHNAILNRQDQELGNQIAKITGQKIYYLDCNPTAEEMGNYLFSKICPQLFSVYKISCCKIKIFETPNCYAEVR